MNPLDQRLTDLRTLELLARTHAPAIIPTIKAMRDETAHRRAYRDLVAS